MNEKQLSNRALKLMNEIFDNPPPAMKRASKSDKKTFREAALSAIKLRFALESEKDPEFRKAVTHYPSIWRNVEKFCDVTSFPALI